MKREKIGQVRTENNDEVNNLVIAPKGTVAGQYLHWSNLYLLIGHDPRFSKTAEVAMYYDTKVEKDLAILFINLLANMTPEWLAIRITKTEE